MVHPWCFSLLHVPICTWSSPYNIFWHPIARLSCCRSYGGAIARILEKRLFLKTLLPENNLNAQPFTLWSARLRILNQRWEKLRFPLLDRMRQANSMLALSQWVLIYTAGIWGRMDSFLGDQLTQKTHSHFPTPYRNTQQQPLQPTYRYPLSHHTTNPPHSTTPNLPWLSLLPPCFNGDRNVPWAVKHVNPKLWY